MKTNQQIALEVIMGKWGNGAERRKKLTEAGYNYENVQTIVNALISGKEPILIDGKLEIKGHDILEIEVNLNEYCGIALLFTNGGDSDAVTST